MMRQFILAVSITCAFPALPITADDYETVIRPFLNQYCVSCHGADQQKADRRYDTLTPDFADDNNLLLWQDITDQLNLGDMPPSDADHQPTADQTQRVIEWATAQLATEYANRDSHGAQTIYRRLNRDEYNRTVRTLLALEPLLDDPTSAFPPDETEENFDNIGAALITSDFLLQGYLDSAKRYIDHAVVTGSKPETKTYHFTAPFYKTGNRHDGQDVDGEYQNIRKNTTDQGGFLWLAKFPKGVPHSGYYKIRFQAQGVNREYPYDESIVKTRKDSPLRVGIVAGLTGGPDLEFRTPSDRPLAEFDLPDDQPEWIETTVWLDKGYQPRFTFPNGPNRVKAIRKTLVHRYPETFEEFITNWTRPEDGLYPYSVEETLARKIAAEKQRVATETPAKPNQIGTGNLFNRRDGWASFYAAYMGPRVRIHQIEIEGPLHETWPPAHHRAVFGDYEPTLANAEPILRNFAQRAFRRPVTAEELAPLVALANRRHRIGDSQIESLKASFRAILCSPNFLYLEEQEGRLDDYALATRLSYFLWSAPPDAQLLELADAGKLSNPKILKQQTARLLDHPNARNFTNRFTERWLELYKIGSMPPSEKAFPSYYVDSLESAIKTETQLFFQHILQQDLPIDRFLDADFTFVNGSLARLYGIPNIYGADFRKVSLDTSQRGGLLGHASILTASANGIDTSPVIRGIWVLENILGTHPAPPPPDVEPLEPDIRGATTVRDQLQQHREIPACNECHQKIDPLGFALENYDPIGAWRTNYARGSTKGPPIDASGQLPDGQSFRDVAEFKVILGQRRDQFARCLTEKLFTYAMGRTLEVTDRPHIDSVVAQLDNQNRGLKTLVQNIVASELFQTK
tara:strand:- start:325606 stop:328182 length:2577 start_codon:yes stop_codon:yes gene_type:complete